LTDARFVGPRVVGRDREIERLENALRGAAMGVAHVALVFGEPGIGKTAVLNVVAGIASGAGATVIRASGEEFEAGLSFGVVDQLLGATGQDATSDPADRFSVGGDLVARWKPQGDSAPIVVIVDDAQWADAPSMQALTFALRRLGTARLLAIVACRTDAMSELPPGLVRLADGETGSRITLAGLDGNAFAELLQRAGVGRMTPAQVERIRDHTDGNPMHALALTRELERDELLSDVAGPLQAPKSIASLALARTASLSADAEALVVAASVLGPACLLSSAAELAGLDDASAPAAEAKEAGILVAYAAAGGTVIRFAHSTTRSAVYHDVGADRIAALHRTAATLVTEPREVLRHRLLGAYGPDETLAMKADATAEALARTGAWIEAATWLGAAERVSSTTQSRTRRRMTAELYRLYSGNKPRIVPGTELDNAGDHPLRNLLLGTAAVQEGRFTEAEAFLRGAWEMVDPSTDRQTASRIAARMTDALQGQLRSVEALEWASRSVDALPDDHDLLGEDPISSLVYAFILNGRLEDARELVARRVRYAVAPRRVAPGLFGRGLVRLSSDDLVGAIDDLRACAESYMRVGPPRVSVEVIRLLAEASFRLGEWDVAARRAEDAVGLARELGVQQVTVRALATGMNVLAARGRFRAADALLDEARELLGVQRSYHTLGSVSIGAARLAIARGDHQSAVDALATVASVVNEVPHVDQQVLLPWRLPYGLGLAAVGRTDEALEQARRLAKYAANQRIGSIGAGAARLRGVVAAARGEIEAAIAEFRDAAEVFAAVPMPFEAALVDLDLGAALRRAGRRREASERLEAARVVLARLDAVPFVRRCDAELAECELSLDTVASALSPAEAAVAGLVAEGRSNREVAAELVISVRTVEHHLRSIYAKLGLSSRTQLTGLLKSK